MNARGQSLWYDFLSKRVLDDGTLAGLIETGVSGLTSNPTIFKKAIADTADYDQEIKTVAQHGFDLEETCEALMIRDVKRAAQLLSSVYKKTKGKDGYASIEVSPLIAKDPDQTYLAANRIWNTLESPNGMIKIPATDECIPVIETLLSEGININITLIFSVNTYAKVTKAYINALKKRAEKGLSLENIFSVASFFVSRVDEIVEKELEKLEKEGSITPKQVKEVLGKAGIANSAIAYKHYQSNFQSDLFQELASKGAKPQKLLWASTGTKNKDFEPLMYASNLIAADTVNTLKPETLELILAGMTPGRPLEKQYVESETLLANLDSLGIDFDALMNQLTVDGIAQFADSYQELLKSLDEKIHQLIALR